MAVKKAVDSLCRGSPNTAITTFPVRDTRLASRKAPAGSAANWKALKPVTRSNARPG